MLRVPDREGEGEGEDDDQTEIKIEKNTRAAEFIFSRYCSL